MLGLPQSLRLEHLHLTLLHWGYRTMSQYIYLLYIVRRRTPSSEAPSLRCTLTLAPASIAGLIPAISQEPELHI